MKITNAFVCDPPSFGTLELPYLTVQVDAWPDVTIQPETFTGGWTVGKNGPFVHYQTDDGEVDAGDFNVRFRNRFPVVVDIGLELAPAEGGPLGDTVFDFALPLTRARQLLKKHQPEWKLLLSDRDAQSGALLWTPVQTNPSCKHWLGSSVGVCGDRPTRTIRVGEVDLPLCSEHVRSHNERHAAKRAASSR